MEKEFTDHSSLLEKIITQAKKLGMDQVAVRCDQGCGLDIKVFNGKVVAFESQQDNQFDIKVIVDNKTASASLNQPDWAVISQSLDDLCDAAKQMQPDNCAGLADAELMATAEQCCRPLDLDHPTPIDALQQENMARDMESALCAIDSKLSIADGVSVGQYRSHSQYANSHGFAADRTATRYSRVCPVLVRDGQRKHRDHDFSVARSYEDLTPPAELVASAANKAIMRCGAKTLTSREASVIFDPSTAKCIWSTVLGALAGSRIYQKASFLKDAQGQRVMPEHLSLIDDPWRLRGLGSANFDAEGVATRQQGFIESGVLQRFITSSYSARKLGTVTSATAGGVHNLTVLGGTGHLKEMLQSMGDGLLVTELMGSGIDVTTGQLSLGVFGYWIAGGQITHPVEGMTLAGDLSAMLLNIHRVGADIDYRSTLNCGSLWINKVALAGH